MKKGLEKNSHHCVKNMNHQPNNRLLEISVKRSLPGFSGVQIVFLLILLIVISLLVGSLVAYKNHKAVKHNSKNISKLIGKWVRPDGGYVIKISSIHSNGNIDVAYFNPNAINVEKAYTASRRNNVQLYVELNDAGYPGSKYYLVYKPQKDILQGIYFQAHDHEFYNVFFLRNKN